MSIRRLARQSVNTNAVLADNWTTQATENYIPVTPAVGPVTWGTDPEIANLDRDFDATGSTKVHLGALLTFTSNKPDFFWGAVFKLAVTYTAGQDPQLEMWTHTTANGWVKSRKVDAPALMRSGDQTVVQLLLDVALTDVDMVWLTLAPSASETVEWTCLHLYGDCLSVPQTPDCPQFSDPPDCSIDCDTLFPAWDCNPDDPNPPPVSFPLPPVLVRIPMPTTYTTSPGASALPFPDPDPESPFGGPTAVSGDPPSNPLVREMNYFNFANVTASANFATNVNAGDIGAEVFAMAGRAEPTHITDPNGFVFPPPSRRFSLIFSFSNMPVGSLVAMRSFHLQQSVVNVWTQVNGPNNTFEVCDASDGLLSGALGVILSPGIYATEPAFTGTGSGFRVFKVITPAVGFITVYTEWLSIGASPHNVEGWAFRFWLYPNGPAIPRVDIIEGGYAP